MPKDVLVLGAGMVAKPLVDYLLAQPELRVAMASRTEAKAEALVAGHERGVARPLNVQDEEKLDAAVAAADLVISFVPYI